MSGAAWSPDKGWHDAARTSTVIGPDGAWSVYTLPPRDAAIAAHAQARGDWNTWDYETRYAPMVRHLPDGRVRCGDWTAREGEHDHPSADHPAT